MRILDINYNELSESEIDLENGALSTTFIVKSDATPVDDVTKFAYDDDDYEEVQIYQPYEEPELSEQDKKIKSLQEENEMLRGCIMEIADVVFS